MHPVWAGLIKSSWLWLPPLLFLVTITYLFERGQADDKKLHRLFKKKQAK